MKKKKIIASILSIAMVIGMMPTFVRLFIPMAYMKFLLNSNYSQDLKDAMVYLYLFGENS